MKRQFWACCLSACLGAIVTSGVRELWREPQAAAQQPVGSDTRSARRTARMPPVPADTAGQLALAASVDASAADPGLAEFTPEERVAIAVYEKANRSAVHITTRSRVDTFFLLEVPTEGSGSGSVLDHRGHILTNFHVIDGAREIRVTLFNNESYPAELIGGDAVNDIAVLKIDAPADALFPVELGDSARLRVGQQVFAIGNPFGMERTLTTGVVSSLNRSLPSRRQRMMRSIIQIDAALNRGNSGGPLLNSRGVVIGMNAAIASSTGENTGVGFAIPVNTIKRVVPQLIQNGRVIRADLGVARMYDSDDGLLVVLVAPGGPAERAGMRGFSISRKQQQRGPFVVNREYWDPSTADIIVAADGKPVQSSEELLEIIDQKQAGDEIIVRVRRGEGEVDLRVTLGSEQAAG